MLAALFLRLQDEFQFPLPTQRRRYTNSFLVFHFGFLLIVLAMGVAVWRIHRKQAYQALAGVIVNLPLVVLTLISGHFLNGNFSDPVCGVRVGCFAIGVVPIPTDVVFQIWSAPTASTWVWTWTWPDIEMNYSEDGSYLSDPHLILSGNEHILVLARGGYLVDAIEIPTGQIQSEFIVWNSPDRDAEMQANSDRIGRLLEANR